MGNTKIVVGDCRDVMAKMEPNCVDTVITDPPYGLGFMGKEWDHGVPGIPFWEAALRVAKPGATMLAFGGTRTHHRLMVAIEDAGWVIRDVMMWVYGSGFSKGSKPCAGWGTTLKPAWEPIVLAMKPKDGTFIQNLSRWGVAGLWIDGGRVPGHPETTRFDPAKHSHEGWRMTATGKETAANAKTVSGRWPANLIHDGSEEVVGLFPQTKSGGYPPAGRQRTQGATYGKPNKTPEQRFTANEGSAARFFYCAKASRAERTANGAVENRHPTVKPLALLRYLCRITKTPTGGVVLDPFMGSGSTLRAAMLEGRSAIGIEISDEYAKIATDLLKADALTC